MHLGYTSRTPFMYLAEHPGLAIAAQGELPYTWDRECRPADSRYDWELPASPAAGKPRTAACVRTVAPWSLRLAQSAQHLQDGV